MIVTYNTMDKKPLRVIYTCFPGGKHKVLTMSYDDGRPEDRRLVSIFNEHGIKGTFNINSMLTQDDRIPHEEFASLYAGHEVACHTALHPTIARCPDEQVLQEVLEDRRQLEAAVGYTVRGLAYPNGSVNQRIVDMLPYCGIKYARTVHSTCGFAMPDNLLLWDPTMSHNNPEFMNIGKQFVELFKKQYLYMCYVWGHSYEFGMKDNWNVIEDFCKLVGGKEAIWYATNIEIVDYLEDAKRLQVSVDGDFVYNPNAQDIWIGVDNEVVCCKAGEKTEI